MVKALKNLDKETREALLRFTGILFMSNLRMTLEGLQEEAAEFGAFIADQGAEQCGFCNPGFIMNALALFREKPDPNEEEIKEYLAGNLCRCSGYEGQLRGIQNFLAWKKSKEAAQ